MKLFLLLALAAVAASAPQKPSEVQILRYENDNAGLDSYNFVLEQSDGTFREEKGELKNKGSENAAVAVVGKYSWVAPDGTTYTVTYTADENGFQPQLQTKPSGPPSVGAGVPGSVVASLLG